MRVFPIARPAAWFAITAVIVAMASGHVGGRSAQSSDIDADGLDDRLEQQLLEKFLPQFQLSRTDCDQRPAAFVSDRTSADVVRRDGTLYGQAFRIDRAEIAGVSVELHFFHLWGRDCGQKGHPLDAEHVSALVWADSLERAANGWEAQYWFAAAHQETPCDASHGARADAIDAARHGPPIWISRGKHASFLRPELCLWNCGGDRCKDTVALVPAALVNIGEPGAPMHGSAWIADSRWPLLARMGSDFPADALRRLDLSKPREIIAINSSLSPFKAFALGGSVTASSLARGRDETGNALGRAFRAVGNAFKAAGRFLVGK